MVNARLFPGNFSTHSQESMDLVLQSLDLADRMAPEKKLLVMDCGFDSQKQLKLKSPCIS